MGHKHNAQDASKHDKGWALHSPSPCTLTPSPEDHPAPYIELESFQAPMNYQYSYDYQTDGDDSDSDDSDSDDSDLSMLMDEAERTLEPGACESQASEESAHLSSLLALLEDSCWKRRIEALKILSDDPSVTSFAGHIIPKLADTSYPVCCEAMATLAKFNPKVLAEYAPEYLHPPDARPLPITKAEH